VRHRHREAVVAEQIAAARSMLSATPPVDRQVKVGRADMLLDEMLCRHHLQWRISDAALDADGKDFSGRSALAPTHGNASATRDLVNPQPPIAPAMRHDAPIKASFAKIGPE